VPSTGERPKAATHHASCLLLGERYRTFPYLRRWGCAFHGRYICCTCTLRHVAKRAICDLTVRGVCTTFFLAYVWQTNAHEVCDHAASPTIMRQRLMASTWEINPILRREIHAILSDNEVIAHFLYLCPILEDRCPKIQPLRKYGSLRLRIGVNCGAVHIVNDIGI